MILTLRTDRPESEIGLYDNTRQVAYIAWPAHRQLAETIHQKMANMLTEQSFTWADISGIVVYEGPGSFTGLRIGMSVANALAASYGIPIVAMAEESWVLDGINRLVTGETDKVALPQYGSAPNITAPRK